MAHGNCGGGTCGGGGCNKPCKNKEVKEETWPKKCGCGAQISEDQWETLHYVGVQKTGFDDIPDLELRNCRCGSTLAVAVPSDFN